ncbi:CAP domain-containing protein [Streptomyces sp. NPDC005017]|uniref:CAP domain-containing protein n=1 Tax=Streptomyces sp. NPDC005017 TaxID=3364706 RepID=UPI0036861331
MGGRVDGQYRMDEEGQNMGRHRRIAAGRAATGRVTGVTPTDDSVAGSRDPQHSYGGGYSAPGIASDPQHPYGGHGAPGIAPYLNPEAYAEAYASSTAYLYATDWRADDGAEPLGPPVSGPGTRYTGQDAAFRTRSHRRPRKKAVTPVRTGLLGVSAAVALGAVAVSTGVLPGVDNYRLGGSSSDQVQSAHSPGNLESQQGGTSGAAPEEPSHEQPGSAPRGTEPAAPAPSASPSASASPTKPPAEKKKPKATPSKKPADTPSRKATKGPAEPKAPVTVSAEAAAEAEVLRLVNVERENAGCTPLAANSALTGLARVFSEDMAQRGFFDHTDPDGSSPWDRAEQLGIIDLGGENIARGQADAAAVMQAWMNSPGHRANILNCDFKTLGVGVHYGDGGPWWTQDFGY